MHKGVLCGVVFVVLAALPAQAQDVDVPGNLTMVDSTATAGNILKGGVPFLHNFGDFNTFIGQGAGNLTMTGSQNAASGESALSSNTTGNANTASGHGALRRNTTGSRNTASGRNALFSNSTGDRNTASGNAALIENTTGFANTASGDFALFSNTTGFDNTASGADALFSNLDGRFNTASGSGALLSNSTGDKNTAVGVDALQMNTTADHNTAIGFNALVRTTTGFLNTAIGTGALSTNTIGTGNTAVGRDANVSVGDLFNATAIGARATVDASDKIRLGDEFVTVIEAQVGLTVVSDRHQKENFQPVEGEGVLKKIRGLSLTSWNLIGHDPKQFRHYGPTAQDFFAAFGQDGIGTVGSPTTITSTDMDGILMVSVQALEKRTVELGQEKERLTETVEALKAELQAQRQHREIEQREQAAQIGELKGQVAQNADLKARLEAVERLVKGTQTASRESNYPETLTLSTPVTVNTLFGTATIGR